MNQFIINLKLNRENHWWSGVCIDDQVYWWSGVWTETRSTEFDFNVFIVGKSWRLQTATTASALPPGRVRRDWSDILWGTNRKSDTQTSWYTTLRPGFRFRFWLTDTSNLHAGSSQSSESRLSSRTRSLSPETETHRTSKTSDWLQISSEDRCSSRLSSGVFTCFLRWPSAWCAALWFPALCSAERRPAPPTWRHTETTRLCRPSPSSHRSHGRSSPWKHTHAAVRPIRAQVQTGNNNASDKLQSLID